jgi:hypothetical protein
MTNFVLINPFEVPEDVDDDRFLEGWGRAADYMRSQPASSLPSFTARCRRIQGSAS